MKARQSTDHGQLGRGTVERSAAQIFLINDRTNQMLIEHLESATWVAKTTTARPPTAKSIREAQLLPVATSRRVIVSRCIPVVRSMPRIEFPSVSAVTTVTFSCIESAFIIGLPLCGH